MCKKILITIRIEIKSQSLAKNLLMVPKDQDPMLKKSGVIYRYKCDRVECDEGYIRKVLQNFWRKVQRTPEGPIPHL